MSKIKSKTDLAITNDADVKEKKENIAVTLATKQRDISVSEFFAKNRHLLGFDNSKKALLTVVKEAVDNSLDACEEADILPEITVEITELSEDRFTVSIEDNGPGIVQQQISKIFAKLLYGSKFHSMKMSRGQQGIGISAAVMYGQITTGKPSIIVSKTGKNKPAHYCELHINLEKNQPEILKDNIIEWEKEHGTKVLIEMEAKYQKGKQSVDEYLRLTAIANPHLKLKYVLNLKKNVADNSAEQTDLLNTTEPTTNGAVYDRASNVLPKHTTAIKPHPHGIELGILMRMLKQSKAKSLKQFLSSEFSRVSPKTAEDICNTAEVNSNMKPLAAGRNQTEAIFKAIQKTKIMNPSTDCIAPIGEDNIIAGLKRETDTADLYVAVTRPPSVYRGIPFQVEVGIAYGGKSLLADELIQLIRYANRVPLLYQQSACASFKTAVYTSWKNYGLMQAKGALPTAPMIVFVHIASVWVPFTSESKEAIASYPEILHEMRLAFQEAGRKLFSHIRHKRSEADEFKKRSYIEKYIPHIGAALKEILNLNDKETASTVEKLHVILERSRNK